MGTKNCLNCGKEIHIYATKCKYCGARCYEDGEFEEVEIRSKKHDLQSDLQLTTLKEQKNIEKAIQKEEQRKWKKEQKRYELKSSWSYTTINNTAKWMDKYHLDAIIGLIPGAGDIVPTLFIFPYIYVSLFKIRSIPLTLAVIYHTMVDWLISIVPYIGAVGDFFYRSFKKNMALIVGFVEDDKEIIREVNKKAVVTAILIVIVGFAIWWLITTVLSMISGVFDWISGLFA